MSIRNVVGGAFQVGEVTLQASRFCSTSRQTSVAPSCRKSGDFRYSYMKHALVIAEELAAGTAAQRFVSRPIDCLADEAHRGVGHGELRPRGVIAAEAVGEFEIPVDGNEADHFQMRDGIGKIFRVGR